MRTLFALIALWIIPSSAIAEGIPDPKVWVEKFMVDLTSEGVASAHELLLKSHVGKVRPYVVSGIRGNMQEAEESYGKALGFEFMAERDYGKSLRVIGYYVKRETKPVLWKFVFYRPTSGNWLLMSFALSDDLGELKVTD